MSTTVQLSAIRLRVRDLGRSLDFYHRRLGFVVMGQNSGEADLGGAPGLTPVLTLAEDPAASPPPPDAAGLFHAALLFPTRPALGSWLKSTAAQGVDFEGFSDHGVSEAIYLSDPDGNGLEFYADRPSAAWPYSERGEIAMTTRPLSIHSLLAEAAAPTDFPLANARWGHLHLRVTNLERSEAFYCAHLGMTVMQRSYPGARFLAADGYHHHIGLNTWGTPSRPQPAGSVGLGEATFATRSVAAETRLVDPDGIHLRVQPMLVHA